MKFLEHQAESTERVTHNPEFKDILDAIQKAKEDKNTLISLTEDSLKKSSKKKEEKKEKPKSEDTLPDLTVKVISKKDVDLKESAAVLVDSIDLLKNKKDWTHDDARP